jgi:hypothetical protein
MFELLANVACLAFSEALGASSYDRESPTGSPHCAELTELFRSITTSLLPRKYLTLKNLARLRRKLQYTVLQHRDTLRYNIAAFAEFTLQYNTMLYNIVVTTYCTCHTEV